MPFLVVNEPIRATRMVPLHPILHPSGVLQGAETLERQGSCGIMMAEREGFEPSVPRKRDNGFRDRPVRPLRHLSA